MSKLNRTARLSKDIWSSIDKRTNKNTRLSIDNRTSIDKRSNRTTRLSKENRTSIDKNRQAGDYRKIVRKTKKVPIKNVVYKYLTETSIELPYDWEWNEEDHPEHIVPPTTPNSNEYQFEFKLQLLPQILHDLTTLELPVVRKCGIKQAIEELGLYFGCNDYKYNLLQFWFLDVITDCIWKSQDRFEFLPEQQKIILSWVLFMLDIIGDLNYTYTQKECFAIFKEAIIAAAEVLEEGSNEILLPLKLIKIRTGQDSVDLEESSEKSIKTETCHYTSSTDITVSSEESKQDNMDYNSVYEIDMGTDKLQLCVEHEMCYCSEYDLEESSPARITNASEPPIADYGEQRSETDWMDFEEEEMEESDFGDQWDYRDFYKPCSRTPSRFLASSSEEISIISESLEKETSISLSDFGSLSKLKFLRFPGSVNTSKNTDKLGDKLQNYIIFRKASSINVDTLEPEDTEVIKETTDASPINQQNNQTEEEHVERIMKGLQKLKIIEQRMRDLSDSKVGLLDWQTKSDEEFIKDSPFNVETCIPESYLDEQPNICDINDAELINFSILWAIIDFIYDYFGDSFQFNLVKTALTVTPNIYTQVINQQYQIPKTLVEDLTSKVPDLKEKNKKFQRKIELTKNKAGKARSASTESKKQKRKKSKNDKKEDSKKSPKTKTKDKIKAVKKETTDKEVKLTKEELLLIQKLEEDEALRLKQQKNKIHMFPLTEAVTDRFFSKKFSNWVSADKDKIDENVRKLSSKKKK